MRLLHTSDWHLGRSFHREDLLAAQARFVDFLVETVRSERVDAVLVSGDVYDRALPSVDAVALCNDALRRLAAHRRPGRAHQRQPRLRPAARLRRRPDRRGRHPPAHRPGALRRPGAARRPARRRSRSTACPTSSPTRSAARSAATSAATRAVLGGGDARVRADLAGAGRAPGRWSSRTPSSPVASRATASATSPSAASASVPAATFAGIDYAALGHLHGAQQLADGVRYSGSPLAYSFSEEHHRKAVLLVDLPAAPAPRPCVEPVPTPVERPLARLRGRLDDLLTAGRWAAVERPLPAGDADRRRPAARADGAAAGPLPARAGAGFEPEGTVTGHARTYAARLRGRSDLEVAAASSTHVRGGPSRPSPALLREAFEAGRLAEASV